MKQYVMQLCILCILLLNQHTQTMYEEASLKSVNKAYKNESSVQNPSSQLSEAQKKSINQQRTTSQKGISPTQLQNNIDATLHTLNISPDSLDGETLVRQYDPSDTRKFDTNGPTMAKSQLKDGSIVRTYFNFDGSTIKTNITNPSNPKTNIDINYNSDGTITHISNSDNGSAPRRIDYKNQDEFKKTFKIQDQTNSTTDLLPEPKTSQEPVSQFIDSSTQSDKQITQSNKQFLKKAPNDIREKNDQRSKINFSKGSQSVDFIINMYKKPDVTITSDKTSLNPIDFSRTYQTQLSDGTIINTKTDLNDNLISTDVTNFSNPNQNHTTITYNSDGSMTEVIMPKNGSLVRTVTYNQDGSVTIENGNDTKHFTKEEAAAKKTGISGKINWLKKRSQEAYENMKKSLR